MSDLAEFTREKAQQIIQNKSEPVTESGCWIWMGTFASRGYGRLTRGGEGNRRSYKAHRVSFAAFNGPIPDNAFVLHSCDTPCCVNPDHLRVGTHDDNMADKTRRRRVAGNRNPNARLAPGQVLEIRERYTGDWASVKDLASLYGVGPTCIWNILSGRSWSDLRQENE